MNEIVLRLGLVSLFNDISTEMLYPITPIFLTAVLGASMTSVGVIEGFSEFIASFLKMYFGRWSDVSKRRKPFVIAGYSLSTFARPMIGLAQAWPFVLLARAIDRVGKSVRSAPRDALLADSVDRRSLGAALGWHRGLDSLGAVLGPLAAVALLSRYADKNTDHLRSIYFWAAIPAIIAVLLVFSVREPKSARQVDNRARETADDNPTNARLPREFYKYLFAWGVFSIVNSSDAFLLLKMRSAGLSLTMVILLYGFYNLFYSVTSPWLGHISDRNGRKKIMSVGWLLFSFVYFGFSRATSLYQFAGLLAVYGTYMGATDGVGKAWAIDLVPHEIKATAVGVLGTVIGLCAMFASFTAGMIWDHFGATGPFIYGGVGGLVGVSMLLFVRSPDRI